MLISPLARAYRSTIGDLSLTALTALLVVFVFVLAPLAELRIVNRHVLEIAFAVILLTGIAARRHQSLVERLFIATAILAISLRVLNLLLPDASIRLVDALVLITAFGLLAAVTLTRTLRPGEITMHRLEGAIAAYMLVGLMFAQAFRLVALGEPGAFIARRRTRGLRCRRTQAHVLQLRDADDARVRRHHAGASLRADAGDARVALRRALSCAPDRATRVARRGRDAAGTHARAMSARSVA